MTHEVITKAFTEVGAEGHVLILFYKREHLFVTTGIAPGTDQRGIPALPCWLYPSFTPFSGQTELFYDVVDNFAL